MSIIDDLTNDISSIESELGVDPQGVYADVRTRLDILEARIDNPLLPSPTVENPFIIGNSGVTISAGIGAPNSNTTPGSLYLRADGGVEQGLYSRRSDSSWHQIDTSVFVVAGDLAGSTISQTVVGLQNRSIASTAPIDGYILTWDGYFNQWQPKISASTVIIGGDLFATSSSAQKVIALQNNAVSSTAPTDGYLLTWVAADNQWEPKSPAPTVIIGGDLFANSGSSQKVIAIQGHAISNTAPTDGYVLTWVNGSSDWEPKPTGSPSGSAGGDLSGIYPNPTVAKANGATIPAAGSLTTGNILQVTGSSALSYAAINLAGGSNFVTGVLPIGNQAVQSMAGDVTGTTASSTVVKLQNRNVASTAPTDGYALTWINGSSDWEPSNNLTALLTSGGAKVLKAPIKEYIYGIAGLQQTSLLSDERGAITFDPSAHFSGDASLTRTVKLTAILECSAAGQSCQLELFNLTDGLSVTSLATSNTFPTTVSATLVVGSDLPNSSKLYVLRLKKIGGINQDLVGCKMARLEVIYS